MIKQALFRGTRLYKGVVHLVLLDTRRRVAALVKILLFGAIAHHAGMGNVGLLLGIRRNCGFIRHIKYSVRGAVGGVLLSDRVHGFYAPLE